MQASSLSMINDFVNIYSSLYEMTLRTLKNYKDNFKLEDIYLGALIMHVRLGNISGFNLEDLFRKLNWSEEFRNDVMYRLKTDKRVINDVKGSNEYNSSLASAKSSNTWPNITNTKENLKKTLKKQYKDHISTSNEVEKYVSNLRNICDKCNKVITPIAK